MSPAKVIILVAVLVIVLFAISLAVSSRQTASPRVSVNPTNSWVSKINQFLAGGQTLDLARDVKATNGWSNGHWVLTNGVRAGSLEISTSKKRIRKARLSLETGSGFRIEYKPRADPARPTNPADAEALPIKVNNFTMQQSPLELTILPHGGYLSVQRQIATGVVSLRLE